MRNGLFVVAGLLGLVVGFTWMRPAVSPPIVTARPSTLESGDEIVALFIGSSTCSGSRDPRLPAAMATLESVAERRTTPRWRLVGIATDWDPATGIEWLRGLARFDEILAGGSWMNLGLMTFLWSDSVPAATLPQLRLLRRTVTANEDRIRVDAMATAVVVSGVDAIIALTDSLAALPTRYGSSDLRTRD